MKKNIIIASVFCVVLLGLCFAFYPKEEENQRVTQVPEVPTETTSHFQKAKKATSLNVSFDIVRVENDGSMVIAGKGKPNEHFSLMDGEMTLAEMEVDEYGEWVFIPETALAVGTHEIWLQDSSFNSRELSEVAVVEVPEKESEEEAFAVLVSSDDEDVSLLQVPLPEIQTNVDIEVVHATDKGFKVQGSVAVDGKVNVYADNLFLGQAEAVDNEWKLNVKRELEKGKTYIIRADRVDENGKVLARVEVPFVVEKGLENAKRRRIQVVKGDCLWTIARNLYGKGEVYTAIYQANKKIIKNPDLIYPNQVFVIPTK